MKLFEKKQKRLHDDSQATMQRILNKDSNFAVVETYKAMRTNIMFSMTKKDHGRAIVVTSSTPGEVKQQPQLTSQLHLHRQAQGLFWLTAIFVSPEHTVTLALKRIMA